MVNRIEGNEAANYGEQLRSAFPNFKTAFGPEYSANPWVFVPQEREYYVVHNRNRPEALFAVTFNLNNKANEAAISFARLVLKDKYSAEGWWYVLDVVNRAIRPRGVKFVRARLETKGSKKTFTDLQAKFPNAVSIDGSLGTIDVEKLPVYP